MPSLWSVMHRAPCVGRRGGHHPRPVRHHAPQRSIAGGGSGYALARLGSAAPEGQRIVSELSEGQRVREVRGSEGRRVRGSEDQRVRGSEGQRVRGK